MHCYGTVDLQAVNDAAGTSRVLKGTKSCGCHNDTANQVLHGVPFRLPHDADMYTD